MGHTFAALGLVLFSGANIAPISPGDEITVTATRTKTPVWRTGASVTIIGPEEISGANRFGGAEDLVEQVAGLQAALANGSQAAFQIRGIGAVDHQALTPTAAAVYADGVYLSTNVQNSLLTFDLDRIEVLKGPQGVVHGRNASGGAISFLSRRPGGDAPAYLEASAGNYGMLNIVAAGDTALPAGGVGRLAGRYFRRDAVLDNISGPKAAGGKRDEAAIRAQALWSLSPETSLFVNLHYAEDNGINPAPRNDNAALSNHQISVGADGIQDTDNEFFGTFAEIIHHTGEWTLFSLSAIEGYNQQYGFDFDGSPAPFGNENFNANLAYDRDLAQLSQEVRLSRERNGHAALFGLWAGLERFQQDYLIWCGELDPATNLGTCPYIGAAGRAGPTPVSDSRAMSLLSQIDQRRWTAALFTRHSYELSERITLASGVRLTSEEITGYGQGLHFFEDGTIGLNNRDGLGPAIGRNEINETWVSGELGISYQMTPRHFAWAALSNGRKSGGFNGEVQNNATHFSDEGLFDAETVTALEAGLKSSKTSLSTEITAFYQWYDSPQARIFVPFPLEDGSSFTTNSLSNLDSAVSAGLETSLDWQITPTFNLSGEAVFLHTEISEPFDPATPENHDAFDGNPLPFAPEMAATLRAQYKRPLEGGGALTLTLSGKYQDGFYFDPEGRTDRRQDAYGVINGQARWSLPDERTEVALWGKNMGDTDYAAAGYGFIGYNRFIADPATWGVRLRREW